MDHIRLYTQNGIPFTGTIELNSEFGIRFVNGLAHGGLMFKEKNHEKCPIQDRVTELEKRITELAAWPENLVKALEAEFNAYSSKSGKHHQ